MKKYLLIAAILCVPVIAFAWGIGLLGGGVGDDEALLGDDSLGGKAQSPADGQPRCKTITGDGNTYTYGYFYGEAIDAGCNFYMAIYNDSSGDPGTLVTNGCSAQGSVGAGPAWNEVVFSPGVTLVNSTTYHVCYFPDEDINYWRELGSGDDYTASATNCETPFPASSESSYINATIITNYDYTP